MTVGCSDPFDLTGPAPDWSSADRLHWADCLRAAVANPRSWRTPHPWGAERLRIALSATLGLDPAGLAITSGTRSVVRSLLGGATGLRVETPTFQDVRTLARWAGVPVTPCRWAAVLGGEIVDRGGVLWLTSPARNPDGATMSRADVERLDSMSGSFGRVVVNETYRWSRPDAPRSDAAVHVGSVSKVMGGGAKVGWIHHPSPPSTPGPPPEGGPPGPWQHALARYIEEGGLARLVGGAYARADAMCARFVVALTTSGDVADGVPAGHAGHQMLLTRADGSSGEQLVAHFARHGLLVSPGDAFEAPASVRISFSGVPENDYESVETALLRAIREESVVTA